MKVLRHFLFVILIGALAACSQQSAPQVSGGETGLVPVPLEVLEHDVETAWPGTIEGVDDLSDVEVEIVGTGLGNRFGAVSTDSINIDTTGVSAVYAQVVLKGGSGSGGDYVEPDEVTVSSDGNTKTWTGGDLTQHYMTDATELDPKTDGGTTYEGLFTEFGDTFTVDIEGIGSGDFHTPRAFVLYVFREAGDEESVGLIPNYYIFWDETAETATEVIDLPADFAGGDVEVTFVISELERGQPTGEDRVVVLEAEVDGIRESATIHDPDQGDELLIYTLTLSNVPSDATTVTTKVTSPNPNSGIEGDSIYWNGVNVTVDTSEEEEGGEGCTPGYWRQPHHYDSWVGYDPDDDFYNDVFDVEATLLLKGKGKPQAEDDPTLGEAVEAPGGGENALARHAVAALLNAASPDVSYAYTVAEVIAIVQEAYDTGDFETAKNKLATENEMGCPLN